MELLYKGAYEFARQLKNTGSSPSFFGGLVKQSSFSHLVSSNKNMLAAKKMNPWNGMAA